MNDQHIIQLILCAVFGLCGYLCLYRATAARREPRSPGFRASGVLLALYAVLTGAFCLIVSANVGIVMLLPALAILTAFIFAASAASCTQGRWRDVSVLPALLLLCYLAAMAFVTLFSRENRSEAVILLHFDAFDSLRRTGSLASVKHLILNVIMFVPLGVLLPMTFPFSQTKGADVLSTALFLTAIIESGQFFGQLGQVDVEDLAANAIGAIIGFAAYLLFARWKSNSRQKQ